MRVWRGITLGFWAVFLTMLLTLSSVYFIVFQTVLNQQVMTSRLQAAGFYTAFRDTVLVPAITSSVSEQVQFTPLLTREMVTDSVRAGFTDQKMAEIGATVTPAVYAWLDKKSPDISYAIPIQNELEAAQQHLSAQVEAKLNTLPACTAYYVEPAVVTRLECMPRYTSVGEVLQEAMASVDVAVSEAPTEFTPESIGLAKSQLGKGVSIPDYLSYLWSVAFITVPLAFLTVLYLILRRKGTGLIVAGSTALSLALVLAGAAVFLGSIPASDQALAKSASDAIIPLIQEKIYFLAIIGGGSGIVALVLGIIWKRAGKNKRSTSKHYVSTDSGD